MSKKILIMAGGTGGHVFPALAIVNALKKYNITLHWLGTNHGIENQLVPKYNITLHTVSAVGLRGKNALSLMKAPFLLTLAVVQTFKIFIKIKPDVALGMGGFASGIGGVVAWLLRIPLVIHEQNAIAGTTNKILSKIAWQTFQAFEGALANAITVGNPVLFSALNKTSNSNKLNLLIIGGSLGAKPINEAAMKLNLDINIWHQTGKANLSTVSAQYKNTVFRVEAFITDMQAAYAWADVVLCRAGAMTISELMLSATPSILIPLPHAIDNHQFHNGKILSNNNAAILIEQKDLNIKQLEKILLNIKPKLPQMSKNAFKLAKPNAASEIAYCLDQATKKS